VRLWGSALQSASPRLRAARQVVLAAVERCGVALRYAVAGAEKTGDFTMKHGGLNHDLYNGI